MRIRVIGCSGAELPGHNIPAFLLDDVILFDAGSFTNVLDEKAQLGIKDIFITHAHLDHIRSIPFLADNIIVGKAGRKISIFGIPPVLSAIKVHLFNSAMWPDFTVIPHPHDAILNLVEIKLNRSLRVNSYAITPYKVSHTVPAVGYLVEHENGRRFFYTGDTGPSPRTWKHVGSRQLHALIIDVSFPNSMRDMALTAGHLTPELLREELDRIPFLPEQIYITHPKPQHRKVIEKELKHMKLGNLSMLRDGDIITV
ncbi:MAG: 3',5'-cyclic-nucleotide phosphodiesterase [Nitrospirae bacterium]|nr:3',5'-cyclic-nucleotide phosphodiesterase [Nitrospirota bacterium]